MKRRQAAVVGTTIVPPLPATSTLWPKLPALRAFLTETAYDDNTPRTPGYVTVRNRVTTFEVTVYDPDSGTRLAARGPDLDTALSLVEKLLTTDEAPWEPDNWLQSQLGKKSKKK